MLCICTRSFASVACVQPPALLKRNRVHRLLRVLMAQKSCAVGEFVLNQSRETLECTT